MILFDVNCRITIDSKFLCIINIVLFVVCLAVEGKEPKTDYCSLCDDHIACNNNGVSIGIKSV